LIVLDASVVVDVTLARPSAEPALYTRLAEHGTDLHAPHLIDAEVVQVLRRYVLRKWTTPARASDAVELLIGMPITRYPHVGLLHRALQLRRKLTVYDALYVALAEALDAPLLTRDAGIARAAKRLVDVIHIP
jgi:predicted nucleic acid-binding protein